MKVMAKCFNCSLPALEEEVVNLILEGQIRARIDSHNKVSTANIFLIRRDKKVLEVTDSFWLRYNPPRTNSTP